MLVRAGTEFGLPGFIRVTTGEEELMGSAEPHGGDRRGGRRPEPRRLCSTPPAASRRIRAALADHPELEIERAQRLSPGPDIIAVIVGPEIPVGAAELEHLPDLRIAAVPRPALTTST